MIIDCVTPVLCEYYQVFSQEMEIDMQFITENT